jgi:hypothetical protein
MSRSILDMARKSAKRAVTKSGFQEVITLRNPDNSIEVEVNGLASKHWINFDTDGSSVNSKNAHICISEDDLTELNYPVRSLNNEVNLFNHKVIVKDSTKTDKNYIIKETFPDETLGLIVCILSDYNE